MSNKFFDKFIEINSSFNKKRETVLPSANQYARTSCCSLCSWNQRSKRRVRNEIETEGKFPSRA